MREKEKRLLEILTMEPPDMPDSALGAYLRLQRDVLGECLRNYWETPKTGGSAAHDFCGPVEVAKESR